MKAKMYYTFQGWIVEIEKPGSPLYLTGIKGHYRMVSDYLYAKAYAEKTAERLVAAINAGKDINATEKESKAMTPETLKEALDNGYELADRKHTRGYVSTKEDPMKARIQTAEGYRNGDLYVLLHNPNSTQYCIRQYLKKKGE